MKLPVDLLFGDIQYIKLGTDKQRDKSGAGHQLASRTAAKHSDLSSM